MDSEGRSELLIREEAASSSDYLKYWRRFVDAASIIWLIAFATSLLSYSESITIAPTILSATDAITLFTLPVFIVDLMLKYHLSENSKMFFKKNWATIISVVPYFRVLRMLGALRVMRLARLSNIPRIWKILVNMVKALYKALKLTKGNIGL